MSLVGMNVGPQGIALLVGFPHFSLLPQHIQNIIWHLIMEARKPHHVLLQDGILHCQTVPAIAHVCQAARDIAFQYGKIYQLGNGTRTWFNPDKDFVFWDSGFNLGELTTKVQNLILPNYSFSVLCDVFEDLFEAGNPSSLQSIYIAQEQISETDLWSPDGPANFFGDEPILALAMDQFDPLIGRVEAVEQWLLPEAYHRWFRQLMTNFDISEEWQDYAGEVLHAWVNTSGRFCNEISHRDFKAFENELLMHPAGGSWWDFFADRAPTIVPSVVFMKLEDADLLDSVQAAYDAQLVGDVHMGDS
ncbi:hypothetical protein F4811DRAFT_174522 [Daldinia bambusicola]|nr:hypothetical protein F4811DRAFT_174522 [Daldinia bambusicola]